MEEITKEQRWEYIKSFENTLFSSKKNFKFKFIKNFDPTEIKEHLDSYTDKWLLDIFTPAKHKTQEDVNSILLFYSNDNFHNIDSTLKLSRGLNDEKLYSLLDPLIKDLEDYYDGRHGRAWLAKLPAGTGVPIHCDQFGYSNDGNKVANRQAIYNSMIHRVHVPITTNDKVTFYVNGETKNLKVGEIWEINNNIPHSVHNNGDTDRIHICFDILPYRWL